MTRRVVVRKVDTKGRVVMPNGFAGKVVEMVDQGDGAVRVRVVRDYRARPNLGKLVAGITEENRHQEGGK